MFRKITLLCFALFVLISCGRRDVKASQLSLNGFWEMGYDRHYTSTVQVPGSVFDLSRMVDSTVWYRRKVALPAGDWNRAYLKLNGARFNPRVYVDGQPVSEQEGGLAPTFHELLSDRVKPGNAVEIEIELQPLTRIKKTNASYVPEADHWRSSLAAYVWDDVFLHWYRDDKLVKAIPFTDFENDRLTLKCRLKKSTQSGNVLKVNLLDAYNCVVATNETATDSSAVSVSLDFNGKVKSWSPESPELYRLQVVLKDKDGAVLDQQLFNYGEKTVHRSG